MDSALVTARRADVLVKQQSFLQSSYIPQHPQRGYLVRALVYRVAPVNLESLQFIWRQIVVNQPHGFVEGLVMAVDELVDALVILSDFVQRGFQIGFVDVGTVIAKIL